MKEQELRKLIAEEVRSILTEADVVPIGPDGNKIEDKQLIRNLNMAVKAVDASLRTKLIDLIEDPNAAKALRNPAQRVALMGAMAIAFGISEKEFTQIVSKIKGVLRTSETNDQA